MKTYYVIFTIIFSILLFGCIAPGVQQNITEKQSEKMVEKPTEKTMQDLKQIKTPHFVDSAPAHGEAFVLVPTKIVINTNFDVVAPSKIQVFVGNTEVTSGETKILADRLKMEVDIDPKIGEGLYKVVYKACWPDGTCHDGEFYFAVNGSSIKDYANMTGMSEITIRMKDIKFEQKNIIISKGTKVTYINNDPVEHFVNSDPHPSHNYLETLNSRGINESGSYSYTFNEAGEFHYHCSAHTGMTASIIVIEDGLLTILPVIVSNGSDITTVANVTPVISNQTTSKNYSINFNHIRAAHFVSSTPPHGQTLTQAPSKVIITFNFNLHTKSKMNVTHNGKLVNGNTVVISNLNLETPLTYDGDGIYRVDYSACWPDGSCHEGLFGFILATN